MPENPESVIVSFDMFVNDWSHRTSFNQQQHARVDIIKGDADHYDVDEGVIVNLYIGSDGGPIPNPFQRYEFEIAPFVRSGGEYAIRFYEINGIDTLNVGVDNASIQLVPEPAGACLMLLGLAGVVLVQFRKLAAVTQR